ncbi:protein snakeskin-like [Athalia rosae]|uniref:protein snakeskin-like n=1 Tax=Athalia rosae TaxID=37344 RepID=UPI00203441FB|nr:protein snakeskin-like [Athalia rosae]XP_048507983.1 protein snakeskin-like [Athalia rosae]
MAAITKLSIIRLFELVLVCVMIGLHYHSAVILGPIKDLLIVGTIGGYLIILIGLFAASLMGTPVNRRVDLFFSVVGCVLFVIAGGIAIHYFKTLPSYSTNELRNIGLSKGSMAIIEAAFFLADAIFTFRGEA